MAANLDLFGNSPHSSYSSGDLASNREGTNANPDLRDASESTADKVDLALAGDTPGSRVASLSTAQNVEHALVGVLPTRMAEQLLAPKKRRCAQQNELRKQKSTSNKIDKKIDQK